MKRREFIAAVCGTVVTWPLAARAQQQSALPVVGFLHAGSPGPSTSYVAAFRSTLAEAGYIENQSVVIEYRYADGQYDKLRPMADDLVGRNAKAIVAIPNPDAARAALAATRTIPVLFSVGEDPVQLGLVASLSRPNGNATGVNYLMSELVAKRLGLLRELLPSSARVGALVNPKLSRSLSG
jgi:putative ABC transport system substrate-binding protein